MYDIFLMRICRIYVYIFFFNETSSRIYINLVVYISTRNNKSCISKFSVPQASAASALLYIIKYIEAYDVNIYSVYNICIHMRQSLIKYSMSEQLLRLIRRTRNNIV